MCGNNYSFMFVWAWSVPSRHAVETSIDSLPKSTPPKSMDSAVVIQSARHPVIWFLKPDGGEIKNVIWTCPIETINFLPKTLQANQQQFTDLIFWKNLGLRQVIGSLMVSSAIEGFRSLGGPGKKQNYKNTLKFATYLLFLFWRKNIVLTKCPLHWHPCATTPCHEECSTPDTTSPNADSEGWSRPLPRAHIPKTQGESHQSCHLQTWMTGCRLGAPVFGWSRDITFL